MAEHQIGEFVKYRSDLIDDHAKMKVWLWDCGPEKPVAPRRPERPHGKPGDPEYDLAVIELREKLEEYDQALRAYSQAKKDFAEWEKKNGGPIETVFWSVDARDALANDKRAVDEKRQTRPRYCISSRTRGYEKLPNAGLPEGMRPGHGQAENLRRQMEGDAEFANALRRDPVFGEQEMRQ